MTVTILKYSNEPETCVCKCKNFVYGQQLARIIFILRETHKLIFHLDESRSGLEIRLIGRLLGFFNFGDILVKLWSIRVSYLKVSTAQFSVPYNLLNSGTYKVIHIWAFKEIPSLLTHYFPLISSWIFSWVNLGSFEFHFNYRLYMLHIGIKV